MFRKVTRKTGIKPRQTIPKDKIRSLTEKKNEQLEIDFGDFFKKKEKPVKIIKSKQKPEEHFSQTITDFLRPDKINVLVEFLSLEAVSAQRSRKFAKRDNLEKVIAHIEAIKKKREEIDWAQQQQKRHYQDRELTRELNDDISRYQSDINVLKKQVSTAISVLFRSSYPKNYAANNVESVILKKYYISKSDVSFRKYDVLQE
ncbi:MAG: hypothetical protein PHU47_01335 [Candidatus ainarchaeum sp.]|nr:hypothetical protein [Candidatus ainarchaeum sp.]